MAAEARAPRGDWSGPWPEWDSRVEKALRDVFGLHQFRPLQRVVRWAGGAGRRGAARQQGHHCSWRAGAVQTHGA